MSNPRDNPPKTIFYSFGYEKGPYKSKRRIRGVLTDVTVKKSTAVSYGIELTFDRGAYLGEAQINGIPHKVLAIPVQGEVDYTKPLFDERSHGLKLLLDAYETLFFLPARPVYIEPFVCQFFIFPDIQRR